MANTNAVIIRKPKLYKVPTTLNLAHNSGINQATYWLNDGKNIIQSIKFNNKEEIDNIWKKCEEESKARYKDNPLNKRVLKSNAVIVEEGLVVIGSHVEVAEENIINILNDFVKKFEIDKNGSPYLIRTKEKVIIERLSKNKFQLTRTKDFY